MSVGDDFECYGGREGGGGLVEIRKSCVETICLHFLVCLVCVCMFATHDPIKLFLFFAAISVFRFLFFILFTAAIADLY